MGSKVVDGDDGLPSEEVGPWAREKHEYLSRYLAASSGARRQYLGPGKAGATFADLFCAFGRAKIRDTQEFIDGSSVAAWKASNAGPAPFSKVFIGDLDGDRRETCAKRLGFLGAPVVQIDGAATAAAAQYRQQANPWGLHLALLDPHSLGDLDFGIIRELAELKRIDMLVHFSVMDLQRNLPAQVGVSDEIAVQFDRVAPGWRQKIDANASFAQVRARLFSYWTELIRELGMDAFRPRLVQGSQQQRLYWLILVSRHPLASSLWAKIGRADRQTEMEL